MTVDLHTVEMLITDNQGNDLVVLAALRLQLALLTLGKQRIQEKMKSIQRHKVIVIDGLTEAEAEKARVPGGKIQAIKMVRERFIKEGKPHGLKEAKDAVDGWMEKHLGFIYHPVTDPRFDSNGQPL
jgi:hypothetical protein